jgi:hypothetical protein
MNPAALAALRAAAQAKGKPLSEAERDAVYASLKAAHSRDVLRERFLKVIRGAGYVNDAPERICAEYLDEYMKDVPAFIAMMEDYEKNDYDPD